MDSDAEKGPSSVIPQANKPDGDVNVANQQGVSSAGPRVDNNGDDRPREKPKPPLAETLRLAFLRIVIASSILTMGYAIFGGVWVARNERKYTLGILAVLLTVFTTIHHLATTLAPPARLPPFITWLDLLFTALEYCCYIAVVGYYTWLSRTSGTSETWFPKIALLAVVALWILALSLVALWVMKVIHLHSVYHPDVAKEKEDPPLPPPSWWKYPAHVLFGTRMWQPGVPGEAKWLIGLRGSLALVAVCALVSYGVYQAIIMPIGEMGMTPQRTYRTPQPDYTLSGNIFNNDLRFSVLLVWSKHIGATTNLTDAVTATARWRQQESTPVPPEVQPPVPCTAKRFTIRGAILDPAKWDVTAVTCPRRPGENFQRPDPFWEFPNFDVRVNYTGLLGGPAAALSDRVSDSVRVYLGMTRDVSNVYLSTVPVSLFPGMNALSVASAVIRQRLRPATLATFGFESQENFLIASIVQTLPNTLPGPAESDPNIGTLGFTLQTDVNEWTVLQDYRSKSVLSGLSALGGLGSLVSTALALILGTSLARTLFRSKLNSPFGLLHNIGSPQKMVAECNKGYPYLENDIRELKTRRGIQTYLFDTLIDVDILGYGKQEATTSGASEATSHANGHDHNEKIETSALDVRNGSLKAPPTP